MDDKQQLSNLDPKLKEAYDRVMGTTFTPPAASAPQQATPATPTPEPFIPPTTVQSPLMQQTPQPVMQTVNVSVPDNTPKGFVAGQREENAGGGISPIIIVLAGIVFFAVYIVFWIKVFNIPIGLPI